MAKFVREIMNHEVFCVLPEERASDVRGYFHALGIAAAPVVDDEGRPIGFVSSRDIVGVADSTPVGHCMTRQADGIDSEATITAAAAAMADSGRHHLPVVDREGRVVGYIGSLDVIRGVIAKPVPHPAAFPRYDRELDVTWTDDLPLTEANAARVPDGPGLLRLILTRAGQPDRVVWSEATHNMRTRVLDLLSGPQPKLVHVADELERGELCFRAASTAKIGNIARAMHAVARGGHE